MLYIKDFSEHKVILSDGTSDYTLTAEGNSNFDLDILEDILDYNNKKERDKQIVR